MRIEYLILPPVSDTLAVRALRAIRKPFEHPGRVLLIGLLLLFAATQLNAQSPRQGPGVDALKNRIRAAGYRVIIGMRADANSHGMLGPGRSALSDNAAEAIARDLERKGLRRHGRLTAVPVVFGEVDEADLDRLIGDPTVETIEPDEAMAPAVLSSGPAFRMTEDTPWGILRVTAPDAWALGGGAAYGAGVKVAYLDSGADQTHPDLLYAGGYNAYTRSTTPAAWADDISACNGHGTHIAGTIAAQRNDFGVVGVAPDVSLYAIKVFQNIGGSCLAYQSDQMTGIDWAISNGIRVISISIGGTTFNSSYQNLVSSAAAQGVYIAASAGNNGTNSVSYPAGYQDALAIGSIDGGNNHSSWSNYGPKLYISAPGESILSTMPGGSYGYKSGTSMAAPHGAGVVALLLARYPGISRSDLLARLQQGALDLGDPGRDDLYGFGLVRARESMDGSASAPQPLALSVTPSSHRDTVPSGATSGDPDSANVSLSGSNSASTTWTAAARHSWTVLTTASGIGSGMLRWTRNPSGLGAGTYVDTITVSAGGLSNQVVDALTVLPPPTPLALSVAPGSRSNSVEVGSTSALLQSATVTLSGSGASTSPWSASRKAAWITLTSASGTGSGTLQWTKNPSGLLAGVYVDTILVSVAGAAGSPGRVIDTLNIFVNPTPLTESVAPSSRRGSTKAGGSTTLADSAIVTLSGAGAAVASWSATNTKGWISLTSPAGIGTGTVRWIRNTTGLAAGTYIDTITVTVPNAIGSPAWVIDTLVLTSKSNNGGGRGIGRSSSTGSSVDGGDAHQADSVYVDVSAGTAWAASTLARWVHLDTATGEGPGYLRWQRDLRAVSYGINQDSILVTIGMGDSEETVLTVLETVVAGADDIGVNVAARALFTPSSLGELEQRMLDALGNLNGRYDVGDFLAYLDRTGANPDAALMARVIAIPRETPDRKTTGRPGKP